MKNCLELLKGNKALEEHFKDIASLPKEQQREASIKKLNEYHEILHNELESFKTSLNKKYKTIPFVKQDNTTEIEKIKAEYQTKLEQAVESTKQNAENETQTQGDTTVDGSVQLDTKESNTQGQDENTQPTTKPGTNKTTVKRVTARGFGKKTAEYDVELDQNQNAIKITNPKTGKEIPKFIERKLKPTKKNKKNYPTLKKLIKNPKWTEIEDATLERKSDNQIFEEEKKKFNQFLDRFQPQTEYQHALDYIVRGGGISLKSAMAETGQTQDEIKWITRDGNRFKKDEELDSVEAVAEYIVSNTEQNLDLQEVRNALIEILSANSNITQAKESLLDIYKEKEEEDLRQYKGSLSQKELSLIEGVLTEDEYLEELTDAEVTEYFEKQLQNYEQGQKATIEQQEREANEQSRKTTTESAQKSKGKGTKKSPESKRVAKDLKSLYKIHREIFGLNRVKAFASAVVTDRMIGTMAKRQGISKSDMYSKIEFRKGEAPTNNTLFQQAPKTESQAFKNWFGNSKVVDDSGKPLVVYHGSPNTGIIEFSKNKDKNFNTVEDSEGFYFSGDSNVAYNYAVENPFANGEYNFNSSRKRGKVYPVYLSLKNPLDITEDILKNDRRPKSKRLPFGEAKRKAFKNLTPEHDGIIFKGNAYNSAEYVAFSPTQIKSINNNGDFSSNNPNILFQQNGSSYWKSTAKEGLSKIKQGKATPEQWVKMITDKGGKGTSQELEWIGLSDFLKDYQKENKSKSIPKEVVEQYIEDNQIEIQEVTKGGNKKPSFDSVFTLEDKGDTIYYNHESQGMGDPPAYEAFEEDGVWNVTSEFTGESLGDFNSKEEVINAIKESYNNISVQAAIDANTKYSEYQLEGGENYREVLLTLPSKNKRPFPEGSKIIENNQGKLKLKLVNSDGFTLVLGNTKKEIEDSWSNSQATGAYKSRHWDESNILAHVRMNERTLPNGERVLFIEEIQSDWAQEGKKRGFDGYNSALPEGFSVNKKDGKWIILNNEGKRVPIGARNTEQEAITAYNKANNSKGVPNMPYKKTDQWVGMAMRRVMQMASNEGFDRVAWVTGEQSADRYDLSKQVRKIEVEAFKTYRDVSVLHHMGSFPFAVNNDGVVTKGEYKGKPLDEVVGKEMASKIMNVEFRNTFEGQDLKVGGEGMKTFYNSILPKVAKKEAQRFDKKAKVEVAEIELYEKTPLRIEQLPRTLRDNITKFEKGELSRQEILDKGLKSGVRLELNENSNYVTKAHDINLRDNTSKQLSIPITQKARLNLSNAVPLFQDAKGAMLAEDGKFIIYALTNPNVSTPVHEMAHVYEHYLEDAERKDILKWAGHKQWTTATSEKFARGFEKYLASGKAPTTKLQKIFDKFKQWLTDIYNGIKGSDIDVELSPKMEEIYAKMLGENVVKSEKQNTKVDTSKFEVVQDEKGKKFYKTNVIGKEGVSMYIPIEQDVFIDSAGVHRPSATEKNKMIGVYMNDSAFTKTQNKGNINNIKGDVEKQGQYIITKPRKGAVDYYFNADEIDPNRNYKLQGNTLIEEVDTNRKNVRGYQYSGNGSVKEAIEFMDKVNSIKLPKKEANVLTELIDNNNLTATDLRGVNIGNPPIKAGYEAFRNHYKSKLGKFDKLIAESFYQQKYNEDVIKMLQKQDTPERIGIYFKDSRFESVVDFFAKKQVDKEQSEPDLFNQPKGQGIEKVDQSKVEEVKPKVEPKIEKIEDFGEKIGGAKKDWAESYKNKSNEDILSQPLSKTFPKPNYKKLIDDKVMTKEGAMVLKYLYDSIPRKPRRAYRLKQWAEKVEYAINTITDIVENEGQLEKYIEKIESSRLKNQWKTLKGVMERSNFPTAEPKIGNYEIRQFDGREDFTLVKGHVIQGSFKTFDDAVTALSDIVNKNTTSKKKVKLSVYEDRRTKDLFIGKKTATGVVRLMEGFKTVNDAHNHLKENREQLEEIWNNLKINPEERRSTNRKRVGADWRQGKDATPEIFTNAFGFRGVEFGNWVQNEERQEALNEAYDAFMDMASVLGISPRSISLNGTLAMAFGSRGKGKAMAHYESDKVVINLTKKKGAGSLAHEWFHALDNFFSKKVGKNDFITNNPRARILRDGKLDDRIRKETLDSFKNVVTAINKSGLKQRSRELDKSRSQLYWSTTIEMGARSFENYIIEKLKSNNEQNDFLANFKETSTWVGQSGLDLKNYPYPLEVENESINPAFDQLFETLDVVAEQGKEISTVDTLVNLLDVWDKNIDKFGNENLSVGLPVAVAKAAVKAMKVAVKTAKSVTQVLRAGLNAIKKTKWYKSLTSKQRRDINEVTVNQFVANASKLKGVLTFWQKKGRDSAMSKEGPVGQTNSRRRRAKRFWNNTFISSQGLDQQVVSVVESIFGEMSALSSAVEYEAKVFSAISKRLSKKAKKSSNKDLYNQQMKAIDLYLKGENKNIPFLSEEEIGQLDYFRDRVDALSETIIDKLKDQVESSTNEAKIERLEKLIETIEGKKGKYMFRHYDAFAIPNYLKDLTGDKPNESSKRRLQNAIDWVAQDSEISEEEAEVQVLKYLEDLKKADPSDFVSATTSGKAEAPFLKKRKNIPEPIRELLGESKDPIKNYVTTVFNMGKYVANLEYQGKLVTTLTTLGLTSDKMKLGYTSLVKTKEGYDLLQDIYVPEQVKEAIDDLQPLGSLKDAPYRLLVKMAAYTKLGKTVLSPITTMRNFLSGMVLSMNAGFSPFVGRKKFAEAVAHSWGTKKSNTELKAENQRLAKLGIINDGAVSREVLGIMNDAATSPDKLYNKSKIGKVLSAFQKAYAMGDDTYKVIGFYVWEARFIKAGYTEAQAEQMATETVRNAFPTYSKIPRNIQKLRRLPLVGTFPSFTYEVWRTNYNQIKFIARDLQTASTDADGNYIKNPLKWEKNHSKFAIQRTVGMAVSTSLATGLSVLSKALIGITDEEDETTKNMANPWQKESTNIYIGKERGIYTIIDATAFFPQETILKPVRVLFEDRDGRDMGDKIKISLQEGTSSFLGTDIFMKTMNEAFNNRDSYDRKIYKGDNILEGIANDPGKLTNYLLKQAGPGIYNNLAEFARANEVAPSFFGQKETGYKEYSNTEALFALFGIRASRINYVTGLGTIASEAKDNTKDIRTEITKKLTEYKSLKLEDINKEINKYDKENKETHEAIITGVRGAYKQGIGLNQIEKALELKGYSKKDREIIILGGTPELKPISASTKKNKRISLEISRLRNEPEKLRKALESLDNNIELFNALIGLRNEGIKF